MLLSSKFFSKRRALISTLFLAVLIIFSCYVTVLAEEPAKQAAKEATKEATKEAIKEEKEEFVVALTKDTFEKFVTEHPLALVEFYAPWCGHCQRLAPEYEKAAQQLKEESSIPLAKVDATAEEDLAKKYEVMGYPTLKLFRNGVPEEYKGGRVAADIVTWVQSMAGPAVKIMDSKDVAEKAAKAAAVAFVGVFVSKTDQAFKTFDSVADSNRSMGTFIAYIDPKAKGIVSVYRKDEGIVMTHTVNKQEDLVKLCNEERFPYVGPITGDNYGDYFQSGRNLVWFAGEEAEYKAHTAALRDVAKEFRATKNLVWLDVEKFKDHAQSALGLKEFPALVFQAKEGRYLYKGKFETSKMVKFLKDCDAGKIEKHLMSDDVPEKNDEAVKIVVGKTFKDMVLQKDKDVLLEVYAPWCGHCKKFEPIYKEFAEGVATNTNLLVAKMDGTTNEPPVEHFEFRGFPTVFFVKAGETKPILYDGERTLNDLKEFVNKNLSKPEAAAAEVKEEL